jgi:hypothetical protein
MREKLKVKLTFNYTHKNSVWQTNSM